jgi:hypothetical protein
MTRGENKLDNSLCSRIFWLYQEKQAYQAMKTTITPLEKMTTLLLALQTDNLCLGAAAEWGEL